MARLKNSLVGLGVRAGDNGKPLAFVVPVLPPLWPARDELSEGGEVLVEHGHGGVGWKPSHEDLEPELGFRSGGGIAQVVKRVQLMVRVSKSCHCFIDLFV